MQCCGIERVFDDNLAASDIERNHSRGPRKTTRILIDYLTSQGVAGATVLDVGGGVGAIHEALLSAGARAAVDVDASAAYLRAARSEATREGTSERISFLHGDFVALAPGVEPADIVTLDRVLCCYDDAESLVALSCARSKRLYGLVYPRDSLLARLGSGLINIMEWMRRSGYRSFIHPVARVEQILSENGFRRRYHRYSGMWQVAVYSREQPVTPTR